MEHPPLSDLADAMADFQSVSSRILPHWISVSSFLREDPAAEAVDGGEAALQRRQTEINLLSNAMHFLSHAQHALSDLVVSCSQRPPRELRARPLQPHPVMAFLEPDGGNAGHGVPFMMPVAGGRHFVAQPMQRMATMTTPTSSPTTSSRSQSTGGAPVQAATSTSTSSASVPVTGTNPTMVNSPPMEMEVTLAPIVVGIEVTENEPAGNSQQQQPSVTSTSSRTSTTTTASSTDSRSIGMAAQELMERLSSSMQQHLSNIPATRTETSPSSSGTGTATTTATTNTNSGQAAASTQTSGTTTSTSTTQVHYSGMPFIPPPPVPLPPGMGLFPTAPPPSGSVGFDPFLPCTSHHLPSPFVVGRRIRGSAVPQQQRLRSSSVPPSRRSHEAGASAATRTAMGATGLAGARVPNSPNSETANGSNQRQQPIGSGQFNLNGLFNSAQGLVQPHWDNRQDNQPQPQRNQPHGQPSSLAMALDPDLLGLFQQLMQDQQSGRITPDEANVMNLMGGVFAQVINAMSGGGGQATTVRQFLSQMSDYSYVEGENIFTDLLMTVASQLTFGDIIQLLSGSQANVSQLRLPLRRFILTRIMHRPQNEEQDDAGSSSSPSSQELETAMLAFADDMFPEMEAMAVIANVREGIDFAETLHSFFTTSLTSLVLCIFQSSEDAFSGGFLPMFRQVCSQFVALCNHCFSDSQASLERLLENRLSLISDDVGPTLQQWTMSSAIGHLRTYVAGVNIPEADIAGFVVGTEEGARRRTKRNAKKTTNTAEEEENFATPRSSPELMDMAEHQVKQQPPSPRSDVAIDDDKEKAVEEVVPFTIPPPVDLSDQAFPPSLLPHPSDANAIDVVVGSEPWHRALPPEWVPIVARDVQKQQKCEDDNVPAASNAYLSTQPAKRRKLATESKPPSGPVMALVTECLQEAVSSAGIVQQQATSQPLERSLARDVMREETQDELLGPAAEATAMGTIKSRLEKDPDFDEERYPNSTAFLKKKC